MNVHFVLDNPEERVSSVRLVVTHRGKRYRHSIGVSVDPKKWRKEKSGNPVTDSELARIRSYIETHTTALSSDREVQQAIDVALNPNKERRKGVSFMDYFKEWSERESSSKRQRKLAYDNFVRLFGDNLSWDDVDAHLYQRFLTRGDALGWSVNYKGKTIEQIKVVMREGYDLGFHSNDAFKRFKRLREDYDSIYLTPAEMELLWNCEFKLKRERLARDLAWLGYLTCARFSDYSRLTEGNIVDGKIRFAQQKTSRQVVLPCSPRVREIFARNGGAAPRMCAQQFNKFVKEICKQAGIDSEVEVVRSEGAEHKHYIFRKWELVSSHTFRRSAATNLYMSGVPAKQVMYLTGHSDITSFERYIRVGREENADILADNPFFG